MTPGGFNEMRLILKIENKSTDDPKKKQKTLEAHDAPVFYKIRNPY